MLVVLHRGEKKGQGLPGFGGGKRAKIQVRKALRRLW